MINYLSSNEAEEIFDCDLVDVVAATSEPEPESHVLPDIFTEDGDINLRRLAHDVVMDNNISSYNHDPNELYTMYNGHNLTEIMNNYHSVFIKTMIRLIHSDVDPDTITGDIDKIPTIITIPFVDVIYEAKLLDAVFDRYFNDHVNIINPALTNYGAVIDNVCTYAFNIQDTNFEFFRLMFSNSDVRFIICNLKYAILSKVLKGHSVYDGSSLLTSLYMHKMKEYVNEDMNLITEKFTSNAFTQSAVYMNSTGKFVAESGLYCMTVKMFETVVSNSNSAITKMFKEAENLEDFLDAYDDFYESLLVYEIDMDEEIAYLIKGGDDD